jgi:predicted nucleic acid-binding protein
VITVDASVIVQAYLTPSDAAAPEALHVLADEGGCVPGNFYAEVAQGLLRGERSNMIGANDLTHVAEDLSELRLQIVDVSFAEIISLSVRHKISPYDAMYLGVARRQSAPFVTFDKALHRAATAERLLWKRART